MNEVIKTISNHVSNRVFDEDFKIDDKKIQIITACLKNAPTHINGQFYSVIIVNDNDKKGKLVELNPLNSHMLKSLVFLLFVADFNRSKIIMGSKNLEHDFGTNIDNLLVVGIDAGLAAMNAVNVVESLGLGCVIVGGVRYHANKIIQLFELPEYTYPSIGKPLDKPGKRPRISARFNIFEEKYDSIPNDFF
ncbi:nitroreductase family protein [Enterococcus sp. AZ072]|uniref:nitroreductase family protein n=1 Tax=unclassified Enterococcus TaxID=2608891 RepID=UPI003D28DA2D